MIRLLLIVVKKSEAYFYFIDYLQAINPAAYTVRLYRMLKFGIHPWSIKSTFAEKGPDNE